MPDTGAPYEIPFLDGTELVRAYPQFSEDLADQIVAGLDRGFRYAGTRYFTSDGTFEKADPLGTGDIGLRAIRVRVQAGGGGGSANNESNGNTGAGGGGGGYAERFFTDIASLSASVSVIVGAGGAGGIGSGGARIVGNNGGDSEFGSFSDAWHTAAEGGDGAVNQTGLQGGSGGQGFAGDTFRGGSGGGTGNNLGTRGMPAGAGGSAPLGGGGRTTGSYTDANGEPGLLYGGGGAGNSRFGLTRNGGNGADGVVIVDCFI